jgi:hypothetical protein
VKSGARGCSLLVSASAGGQEEAAEFLLEQGSDVHQTGVCGANALSCATTAKKKTASLPLVSCKPCSPLDTL